MSGTRALGLSSPPRNHPAGQGLWTLRLKSEMGSGEREAWAERNSDASLWRLGSVCAQQPQTHARLTIPTQECVAVSLSWEEDATL